MFNFNKVLLFSLFLISASVSNLVAQHVPSDERGDAKYRRKAQMEGNQIRTTVFNYGMMGREGAVPITEQTPFEWPKNTGQVYLAVAGIMVGAEVIDEKGETQKIISRCHYLESPEGQPWTFEPIPGYYNINNTEGFASSNDPETWPDYWPDKQSDEEDPGWSGQWNGYFGKDKFNADQELFFRASDDLYDRYTNFFPDSTDKTRKGLGLILDVRVMAWSQILVQDALFSLFRIKNDGTQKLDKVGFSILWADFVGGEGQGNLSEFDLLNDIAWSRNADNKSPDAAFGSDPVGIVGGAFLETPGNAIDRIDNDNDGEFGGPVVTAEMLVGESDESISRNDSRRYDGIDNNGNGLIDENEAHTSFQDQGGVTYADGIDQNDDGEENSPVVTEEMVNLVSNDQWKRWPPNPDIDNIHLIMVESDDIGSSFKDNIDNNDNGEDDSPVITSNMIEEAKNDSPYYRINVGNGIVLYDVKSEDLDKIYADGIDNDGDGAIDENIDEMIDEMIDESRNDGIDNDGDWNAATDDVGLDGLAFTFDEGEGDGIPTSGAGTDFPGEPNIDVTDVSETDQIGITGSFYRTSDEWISTYTDDFIWNNFMVPGNFFDPNDIEEGDYNLYVSSGVFPLDPGQTETISLAIILANGPAVDPNGEVRKEAVLNKKIRAQETYNNDYQFANAPAIPKLTAIPGNNKVTLYWDDEAEKSYDAYIANIGGNGYDFEGYRIYRASDPAFEDALEITNNIGVPTFRLPIVQFDLEDGIFGNDSIGFEGVHFDLGDDTGLQHSWIDSTVQNGFTYYYAITSYDFGYNAGSITPSECNINISLNSDGTVKTIGRNVAQVTPEAASAGYVAPDLIQMDLVEGFTTSTISYEIVDPDEINEGHVYYVTFEDTIKVGDEDTLTTKNYTVFDSTANTIVLEKDTNFGANDEAPLVDGFRLKFNNAIKVEIDDNNSKWNNSETSPFVFEKYVSRFVQGSERPNDYLVIFGDVGLDTASEFLHDRTTYPELPVNFKIFNKTTKQFIEFGFLELNNNGPQETGWFSSDGGLNTDRIIFLEEDSEGELIPTWWFYLDVVDTSVAHTLPDIGDTAYISIIKPFLSNDKFRFVSKAGYTDNELAKAELSDIKVVPNPYIASAYWEPKNPYTSGRGPRSIHFTHLPNECTIRIFTVNGELVNEINHESNLYDGSEEWDLLTKDNLSASYGVYIYHIDAPGIGSHVGKFAIIK